MPALSDFDGALSVDPEDPDSVLFVSFLVSFLVSLFDEVEGSALDLPLEA